MTPFLISPPFGSYRLLDFDFATCVLGSYTLHTRSGRAWQVAKFFWENFRNPIPGGWANHIGLRNPGLRSVEFNAHHLHIYSLVGLESGDWSIMFDQLSECADTHIRFELNLGCPNVHEYGIDKASLRKFCEHYWCGVKLPADLDRATKIGEMAVEAGARYIHAGNTLAVAGKGISGKPLKPVNLAIVEELAKRFPGQNIVGGGGIYGFQDVLDYRNAGACAFSLGTVCFRPWRAKSIINKYVRTIMRSHLSYPY